jgi:hypothetical protein
MSVPEGSVGKSKSDCARSKRGTVGQTATTWRTFIEALEFRRLLSTSVATDLALGAASPSAITAEAVSPITVYTPGLPTGAITTTTAGTSVYVSYSDTTPVRASSLSTRNVVVSGPQTIAVSLLQPPTADSTNLVIVYWFLAPSGGWTAAYNGTYTVALASNSVSDESGNFATGQTLGTFTIAIPQTPTTGSLSAFTDTDSDGFNLTSNGTSDWIHWGRSGVYGATDRDSTGQGQISDVTVVGTGANTGAYHDPSRDSVWSNGSPTVSDSGDPGYIWDNGAINSGYSFTVPADTASRTLTVYAGGFGTTSTVRAHLSDGSAPDYVRTASGSGIYNDSYTIIYNAASAGQTLTITVLKTGNISGTQGSADLVAAMLSPTMVSQPTVPAAPDIFITQSNDGNGNFQWTAPAGATSYNIYRSTVAGGEGSTPYKTSITTSNFTDTGLTDGLTYYYEVTAVNAAGESGKSNEISLSPIPLHAYPPILNSATPGDGQVTLSWTPGVGVTNTYSIYRSTTPGGEGSTPIKTGITGTTYTDTGLVDGTTYYYEVQGVNSTGPTNLSGELAARPVGASTPIYGAVGGQQSVAAAGYNLTQLGTSDWIHWGSNGAYAADDRKSSGGSQISDVSLYGPAPTVGTASNSSRASTWTDGSPNGSETNNSSYILSEGNLNTGYSFTVPADTTTRTLYVYAGGNGAASSLRAHLSDGSAADFVATASGSGIYTNFYTITYKAASAGQTLTITLMKTGNITGTLGSVDLIAAALAPGPSQNSAPVVTTNPASQTVNAGATVTFTAAASGNPAPTVQWQYLTNDPFTPPWANITGATSPTLSFVATAAQSGYEYRAVFSNGVGTAATTSAATLTVNPASSGGSLSGVTSNPASSYNLTAVGTSDWAHWGTGVNASAFDDKATGGSQISNVTRVGSGNYGAYSNTTRSFSWTDGTPLATDTNDNSYIWANTALGAGYSFTVPADTTTRTLYVYLGGASSGGTFTAHLSDGSAADYGASISGSGNYNDLLTITYHAASAGQKLTLSWVKSSNYNGTGGSVDLVAAWLVGSAVNTPPVVTVSPSSETLSVGQDAEFFAIGTGVPTPTLQWMVEPAGSTTFSPISGATSETLDLGAATLAESGNKYEAVFNNGVGSPVTTSIATLTVTAATAAPVVTVNPAIQSVTVGHDTTFTAAATGTPTPTVQWMVEAAGTTTFSPISGATSATLDIGAATLAESGNKYEAVFSNGIGSPATTTAATLTVTSSTSTGSLSGVSSTAASSYNLTTLGTSDWAHWGVNGSSSVFDHKATGGSQISNVTTVGSGSFGGYTDPTRTVSWTDGTPTSTNAGDHGYLWANTGIGAGYSFTVPASTTTHTLYVYLGGYSSGSTLTAHLSDGSAADYVVNLSNSGHYNNVVAITYNAASAGQTLTLTYVKSSNLNGTGGSSYLIAAWLT